MSSKASIAAKCFSERKVKHRRSHSYYGRKVSHERNNVNQFNFFNSDKHHQLRCRGMGAGQAPPTSVLFWIRRYDSTAPEVRNLIEA